MSVRRRDGAHPSEPRLQPRDPAAASASTARPWSHPIGHSSAADRSTRVLGFRSGRRRHSRSRSRPGCSSAGALRRRRMAARRAAARHHLPAAQPPRADRAAALDAAVAHAVHVARHDGAVHGLTRVVPLQGAAQPRRVPLLLPPRRRHAPRRHHRAPARAPAARPAHVARGGGAARRAQQVRPALALAHRKFASSAVAPPTARARTARRRADRWVARADARMPRVVRLRGGTRRRRRRGGGGAGARGAPVGARRAWAAWRAAAPRPRAARRAAPPPRRRRRERHRRRAAPRLGRVGGCAWRCRGSRR